MQSMFVHVRVFSNKLHRIVGPLPLPAAHEIVPLGGREGEREGQADEKTLMLGKTIYIYRLRAPKAKNIQQKLFRVKLWHAEKKAVPCMVGSY